MRIPTSTTAWNELRPFLPARTWLRMVGVGFTSFLGGLSESAILVIVTLTADSLIRQVNDITIGPITMTRTQAVGVAVGLVVLRVCMTTTSAWIASRFAASVMHTAQQSILSSYLHTSHVGRSAKQVGDLTAIAVNHGRFTGDMANGYTMVATGICGLIAFGGTSIAVSPLATLAIAVLGGIMLACLRPLRSRSKRAADEFASSSRELSTTLTEVETLHREIEVFHAADRVEEELTEQIDDSSSKYRRIRFLSSTVPQLFQAAMLGAAVLSLLLVVNNPESVDLAAIGAVVLLLVRSMSAAQQLVMANQRVIEFSAYTTTLRRSMEEFDEARSGFGTESPATLMPVKLAAVEFTYDGDQLVLKGLDVALNRGDLIGVVGPSGAGKSTLVELLLRLREPTGGSLTSGGVATHEIAPEQFARKVAFVPQHPTLITGTVADNVSFFRDVPEERIRAALELAHLADEIDTLPDGIHTKLGADDRALSGGQRQRLTIARALAGDPEIIVLDEPTSALDAISEEAIRRALDELRNDRVVIVVAHRYSTLRSCSRILVLRDGHIEIDAGPDEVAKQSDFFQAMVGDDAG